MFPGDYSPPQEPRLKHCYLADNKRINVLCMTQILIKIGNCQYDTNFHVISEDNGDIILGTEFLTQSKAILDCVNHTVFLCPVEGPNSNADVKSCSNPNPGAYTNHRDHRLTYYGKYPNSKIQSQCKSNRVEFKHNRYNNPSFQTSRSSDIHSNNDPSFLPVRDTLFKEIKSIKAHKYNNNNKKLTYQNQPPLKHNDQFNYDSSYDIAPNNRLPWSKTFTNKKVHLREASMSKNKLKSKNCHLKLNHVTWNDNHKYYACNNNSNRFEPIQKSYSSNSNRLLSKIKSQFDLTYDSQLKLVVDAMKTINELDNDSFTPSPHDKTLNKVNVAECMSVNYDEPPFHLEINEIERDISNDKKIPCIVDNIEEPDFIEPESLQWNPVDICTVQLESKIKPYPKPRHYKPLTFELKETCLNTQQKQEMQELLQLNRDIWAVDLSELGHTHLFKCKINVIPGSQPFVSRGYSESPSKQEIVKEQIDKWLDNGIIEECPASPWVSPIVLVKKPHCINKWRLAIDLRKVNQATIPYNYPIHNMENILMSIGQRKLKYFSTIDLSSAYLQISLEEESKHLTAFRCSAGSFSFIRCAYGLRNLPAQFCSVMNEVFKGLIDKCMSVYLDDILIYSENYEQHMEHLTEVFQRLRQNGFTANPTKSSIAVDSVVYVGHTISRMGVSCCPENVQKILDCPSPTTLKECRMAIGLFSYYKKFVSHFAEICRPLHDTTKHENLPFKWTAEAEKGFQHLKTELSNPPITALADFSSSEPFNLYTDASCTGSGFVLTQRLPDPLYKTDREGKPKERLIERVIMYGGNSFTDTQRRYSTIELEVLSVVFATRKLHGFLFNRLNILYCDARAIRFIMQNQLILNSKIHRWVLELQQYSFIVRHIPGKANVTADYLSRIQHKTYETEEATLHPPILFRITNHQYDPSQVDYTKSDLAKLHVANTNIITIQADALVNATNEYMAPRGGVDRCIQYAGGTQLIEECRRIRHCPLGGTVVTAGYNLPVKYIIHTVGPRKGESPDILVNCYESCFNEAKERNVSKLTIPCISTGAFGFPPDLAAKIAIKCSLEALQENPI
jgi:O-acetyl-ADP-ribose deacetylase (regulator of RNase III)